MDIDLFFRICFLFFWVLLGVVRGYYARKTETHDSLIGIKEKLKTALELEGKWFMVVTAMAIHEVSHLVFGTPDKIDELEGDEYVEMAGNVLADIIASLEFE